MSCGAGAQGTVTPAPASCASCILRTHRLLAAGRRGVPRLPSQLCLCFSSAVPAPRVLPPRGQGMQGRCGQGRGARARQGELVQSAGAAGRTEEVLLRAAGLAPFLPPGKGEPLQSCCSCT